MIEDDDAQVVAAAPAPTAPLLAPPFELFRWMDGAMSYESLLPDMPVRRVGEGLDAVLRQREGRRRLRWNHCIRFGVISCTVWGRWLLSPSPLA